jgi:hypothetical protein
LLGMITSQAQTLEKAYLAEIQRFGSKLNEPKGE